MKTRRFTSQVVFATGLAGIALGQDPVAKVDTIQKWSECDEYISTSPCKITVNMSSTFDASAPDQGPLMPHAHWDVQVKPYKTPGDMPLGEAAVVLINSSPFIKCVVSAVPSAPGRDLSASVGGLLTAVA